MNILQKLSHLENYNIVNKIYSYIGKHPIVEKTKLSVIINQYRLLKQNNELADYYRYPRNNINQNEFPYFYFNYLQRDIFIRTMLDIKNVLKSYSRVYYMDNPVDSEEEIEYKTTLAQRNSAYKYNKNNRKKVNNVYNNYYKNNEEYRLKKIEKSKRTYYLKKECNTFLKILLE